ncbi:hypothetical protein K7432_013959 [Basidiobolus ranarum]|uniref:Uncharacterized protein n=1 Tax=Basidiobolus ranarum TaxID=34480 RepID=A0ABR2WII8_9FUNG
MKFFTSLVIIALATSVIAQDLSENEPGMESTDRIEEPETTRRTSAISGGSPTGSPSRSNGSSPSTALTSAPTGAPLGTPVSSGVVQSSGSPGAVNPAITSATATSTKPTTVATLPPVNKSDAIGIAPGGMVMAAVVIGGILSYL